MSAAACPMHILVHDFAGHPFQTGLSRELARRGHRVNHAYFAGDIGPKGDLARRSGDPDGLSFSALGGDIRYSKSDLLSRRAGDVAYGRVLAAHITSLRPDIVICGNSPTEVVSPLPAAARDAGAAFVYWVQDFNGLAAKRLLARRLAGLGSLVGDLYMWLDRRHLLTSDHVVLISDAFRDLTDQWGVPRDKITVIPNWGPIAEVDVLARNTAWAAEHELSAGWRFVYSGTLALKHNPGLLSALARGVADRGEVVVVSAGTGADRLREQASTLPALRCLPLQPIQIFEQVLASADVLLAIIEREAGDFSVPSKILSYLCAGRPIVLAAPRENLAARIVEQSGAGRVVEPEDESGFVEAALAYADDPQAAASAGIAGRTYAEAHFRITDVADRFEAAFASALQAYALGGARQRGRSRHA